MTGESLVPPLLVDLFAEAITATSDCYLRERFEKQGFSSDELPLAISSGGYPAETRPVRYRVDRYLASVDWASREAVGRLLPLVNKAIGELEFHPSEIYRKIMTALGEAGLDFRDGRILKR